ncbi:hypothetical protein GF420_09000 [candidate division GN15 bacterium]|nr:hypothetical protein [candidate division GN15 bacterium]
MDYYQRTQYGFALMTPTLLVAFPFLIVGILSENPGFIGIGVFFLFVCTLFYKMVVTVGAGEIEIRFGIGLIKKKIRLEEVLDARPVRNRWWYGWGIRYFPGGFLYNISGLDAVELQMRRRPRYRIGTDDPVGLTGAVQARINGD